MTIGLITNPLSSILRQSFSRAKLDEGSVHKLFLPHDLGPPSFLISSLPFSRPREPVDELKADGIDLEALETPELTQSNGMKPLIKARSTGFLFYFTEVAL